MKNYFTYLLALVLFSSCNFNPKESSEPVENINGGKTIRKEQVNLVRDYIERSKLVLKDDEGFPLNHEIKAVYGKKKALGESPIVSNQGTYRNSIFLKLYVQELTFILKLNGEIKDKIKFIAQVYEKHSLNPLVINPIPKEYTKETKIFIPELENENIQKEIIGFATSPFFYQAFGEESESDKKASNDYIRISSKLIKETVLYKKDAQLGIF